jgi:cell division protein FtsL
MLIVDPAMFGITFYYYYYLFIYFLFSITIVIVVVVVVFVIVLIRMDMLSLADKKIERLNEQVKSLTEEKEILEEKVIIFTACDVLTV